MRCGSCKSENIHKKIYIDKVIYGAFGKDIANIISSYISYGVLKVLHNVEIGGGTLFSLCM